MLKKTKILTILLLIIHGATTLPAHPVVLIHGIWASSKTMKPTVEFIQKYLPGTYVKNIEIGHGKFSSIRSLKSQAEELRHQLEQDPELKDGCNIIGYSQGGLIARYFIQKYNNPKVYNLITWGCPHRGIYGQYKKLNGYLHCSTESILGSMLYSYPARQNLSIAGYWHDPINRQGYLTYCSFLPYLNNEKEHENRELYKQNLNRLNSFVLVQSTQEIRVKPVESCHFGFYKAGSTTEIVPLLESGLYKKDLLGLKTLNESGRLHFKTAHCEHKQFPKDEQNFVENTLPFLMGGE